MRTTTLFATLAALICLTAPLAMAAAASSTIGAGQDTLSQEQGVKLEFDYAHHRRDLVFSAADTTSTTKALTFQPFAKVYAFAAASSTIGAGKDAAGREQDSVYVKRCRMGLGVYPRPGVKLEMDYGLHTREIVLANIRGFQKRGAWTGSIQVGRYLGPFTNLVPGGATVPYTRWQLPTNAYLVNTVHNGMAVWVERGNNLIFQADWFNHDRVSAALTVYGFSVFGEKGTGYGAMITDSLCHFSPYLNPNVIYSVEDDSHLHKVAYQNMAQLGRDLRLYGQLERVGNKSYGLAGATWSFYKNSNVELYYDWAKDTWIGELKFYFDHTFPL